MNEFSQLENDKYIAAWVKERDSKIGAEAIREAARAIPTFGKHGELRQYDGGGTTDVVQFLLEYADYYDGSTPSISRGRPIVKERGVS